MDKVPSIKVFFKFLIILFLSIQVSYAQNLVPNAGFERYSELPDAESSIYLLEGWKNPSTDGAFPNGTPDFLHTKGFGAAKLPKSYFGVVHPYKGNGIIGIMTYSSWTSDFREYVSIKLKKELTPDKEYKLSFYFTNGAEDQYGSFGASNLGACLTTEFPYQDGHQPLGLTPQAEANRILYSSAWHKVEFQFTAKEAYTYITLGNFRYDTQTEHKKIGVSGGNSSYYFIDEVVLMPVELDLFKEEIEKEPEPIIGRNINKQESFTVRSREVFVKVWDAKKIDGDTISLKFNGEWVLKNYMVRKTPKTIKLSLNPKEDNYLILFAHNLGTDPPNTAAISFTDKGKERRIVLKSDLSTCGAIELVPIE